jgi:Putative threonine efflux protein
MDIYQIVAFLSASIALTLLPGPDILYVISQSITSGWRSGVAVAVGLCSGLIIHTSAVALGVAALLTSYPMALLGVKIFGAGYLIYLAIGSFQEKGLSVSDSGEKKNLRMLVKKGFIMNVLNPKVLLFFLAFLPQFISKNANPAIQVVILGIIFFIQALIIFSIISGFAGLLNKWVMQSAVSSHIGKIKSAVYLLIAVNLFLV